jgi:hypothetical protein
LSVEQMNDVLAVQVPVNLQYGLPRVSSAQPFAPPILQSRK